MHGLWDFEVLPRYVDGDVAGEGRASCDGVDDGHEKDYYTESNHEDQVELEQLLLRVEYLVLVPVVSILVLEDADALHVFVGQDLR